jgi:hypothetical protein
MGDKQTMRRSMIASSAAESVERLLTARRSRDIEGLQRLLHPIWCAKRAAPASRAEVEERAAFLSRAVTIASETDDSVITSVQVCHPEFAVVRADDWAARSTSIFLLLTDMTGWRIVGEASAGAAAGDLDRRFMSRAEEGAVLQVLEQYYRAVTDGDPQPLRRIFASIWQMKNHENGEIVAEGVEAFTARIDQGPLPGYWDDRQISDVQIVSGRLAFVRVDRPSTPSTTVFLFMKIAGDWLIIDKAWSGGWA